MSFPSPHRASAAFTSRIYEGFKGACYVRFAPADRSGNIPYILYANWCNTVSPDEVERIELLDSNEIRQLRDVCIFEVNGIEVYM